MSSSAFVTARTRAKAEVTAEILKAARKELAAVGAQALSLRAVAREVGMAPSAMYRYFRDRDAILTALIVEAYDSLGAAVERADAKRQGAPPLQRWVAACEATRQWALRHRHEFGLVYGSPVPGYAAPAETTGPGTRLVRVLAAIVGEAAGTGRLAPPVRPLPGPRLISPGVLAAFGSPPAPYEDLVERTVLAWTTLIGLVTFELYGHLRDVVTDQGDYFTAAVTAVAEDVLGLQAPSS